MKYIPLKYFQNQTLLRTQEILYFGDSLQWNFRVSVSFLQLKFFFPFLILFKIFMYQGSWSNSQYMCLSYRNQSIDLQLQCKSINQFVYERNTVWKWVTIIFGDILGVVLAVLVLLLRKIYEVFSSIVIQKP